LRHGKRKLRGNMLGMAHNPWRRIGLGAVVWALLGVLVLAASARAAEAPVALATEATRPAVETVLSVPPPVAAPADPETVSSVPAPEAAPAPAPTPTPAPETTPAAEAEQKAPPPEAVSSPAPEVQTPAPAPAPAPASAPETILALPAPEKAPAAEKAPENPLPISVPEKGQEGVLAVASSGPSGGSPSAVSVVGAVQETPGGPLGPGAVPEVPTTANAGPPSVGAGVVTSTAERVRQFDCALSALGQGTSDCGAGTLSSQRFVSARAMGTESSDAYVAAAGGSASGGGRGGSGVGSPPVSPAPSPPSAPSGASGSAAGSSGLGLSGFLTLAGLLLLGAPRAMRRLRLSCQPWLTACFVLIPERPG
jgi:hypothetical protein